MIFLDDCKRLASSWQQDKTGGKPRVETPPAGPPDLTGRFATGGMMSGSLLPRIDIHASADDTFEQVKEAAAEPNAQVRVKIDDRDWQWLRGDVFLAFLEQREKPEGEGQILVDQVRYPKDMEGNAGMCFQIFDPPVDSDREACESGASENTKEETMAAGFEDDVERTGAICMAGAPNGMRCGRSYGHAGDHIAYIGEGHVGAQWSSGDLAQASPTLSRSRLAAECIMGNIYRRQHTPHGLEFELVRLAEGEADGIEAAQKREIDRLRDEIEELRGQLGGYELTKRDLDRAGMRITELEINAQTLIRNLDGSDGMAPAWWIEAADAVRRLRALTSGNEAGTPKEPRE